jgi:hypothetical protein
MKRRILKDIEKACARTNIRVKSNAQAIDRKYLSVTCGLRNYMLRFCILQLGQSFSDTSKFKLPRFNKSLILTSDLSYPAIRFTIPLLGFFNFLFSSKPMKGISNHKKLFFFSSAIEKSFRFKTIINLNDIFRGLFNKPLNIFLPFNGSMIRARNDYFFLGKCFCSQAVISRIKYSRHLLHFSSKCLNILDLGINFIKAIFEFFKITDRHLGSFVKFANKIYPSIKEWTGLYREYILIVTYRCSSCIQVRKNTPGIYIILEEKITQSLNFVLYYCYDV